MLQNVINLIFCLYSQTNFLLYFLTFYKLCNFKKEFLKNNRIKQKCYEVGTFPHCYTDCVSAHSGLL